MRGRSPEVITAVEKFEGRLRAIVKRSKIVRIMINLSACSDHIFSWVMVYFQELVAVVDENQATRKRDAPVSRSSAVT